jgi:hypothetical protein
MVIVLSKLQTEKGVELLGTMAEIKIGTEKGERDFSLLKQRKNRNDAQCRVQQSEN